MKIPEEIFNKWKDLRSHGDGKKIAKTGGISEMDVSRAFNTQECSDEVFTVIASFYRKKEASVKEFIK